MRCSRIESELKRSRLCPQNVRVDEILKLSSNTGEGMSGSQTKTYMRESLYSLVAWSGCSGVSRSAEAIARLSRAVIHSRTPPKYLHPNPCTPFPPDGSTFLPCLQHGACDQNPVAKHLCETEAEAGEQGTLPEQGGAVHRC
jgi:hypothetical protein